jgi:hypothetical protein
MLLFKYVKRSFNLCNKSQLAERIFIEKEKLMKKQEIPSGPPGWMWWIVTGVQLLSIILHFILAWRAGIG